MAGTVTIPKVGSVKKQTAIAVGAAVVGFIGWRIIAARRASAAIADSAGTDSGSLGTPADLPGVTGAVNPDGTIPPYTGGGGGSSTTGGRFPDNAAWSQDVEAQLQQSNKWTFTDIAEALGNYLASRPLSTVQVSIVQAAIALDGYPPVGSFSIIPGGNAAITVAPGSLHVATVTADSVTLTYSPVAGAAYYRAYRSGVAGNVASSSSTTVKVSGLAPNTSYTFHVAAVSSSGAVGPNSASVTAKTHAVTLTTPAKPTVSGVTKSAATVATHAVSGANSYLWYLNGALHGHSDAPHTTLTGLHSRTKYSVSVAADNASQAPSKHSTATAFTTK